MNKLYSLIILENKNDIIQLIYRKYDIHKYQLFGINSIKEFIEFGFIQMAKKSEKDKRMIIESKEFGGIQFQLLIKQDGIGVGIVTTLQFPKNSITYIIHRSFEIIYESNSCINNSNSIDISLIKNQLNDLFIHFKNNCELTQEERIKCDLDDINEQMNVVITKLIERENELDELIQQSTLLSKQSKDLYKKVKKSKKCKLKCIFL